MYRYAELRMTILLCILRHLVTIIHGSVCLIGIACISTDYAGLISCTWNQKVAICVVSAALSYDVDKCLVDLIYHLVNIIGILCKLTGLVCLTFLRMLIIIIQTATQLFVCTLEDQMIRILFKTL